MYCNGISTPEHNTAIVFISQSINLCKTFVFAKQRGLLTLSAHLKKEKKGQQVFQYPTMYIQILINTVKPDFSGR